MADEAVLTTLALRVGPELISEPWSADVLARAATQSEQLNALDGALQITFGDRCACRLDYWDQLDGLLYAWLSVIAALNDGDSGVITFPDTKIEADAWREGEVVNVQFEDVDVALPWAKTLSSLKDAASRLLRAAKSAKIETVTLRQLQTLLDTLPGERA